MQDCCETFSRMVRDGFIKDWSDENRERYGDNLPLFILTNTANPCGENCKTYTSSFTFCPWCGTRQTILVLS